MNVLSARAREKMHISAFGKIVLKTLKITAFDAFQVPLKNALEKQAKSLEPNFKRMKKTEIGTKLNVRQTIDLENVPFTNYDFYAPYYNNPSPSSFMYPLEDYIRVKTSGTTGRDKWFLIPKIAMNGVERNRSANSLRRLSRRQKDHHGIWRHHLLQHRTTRTLHIGRMITVGSRALKGTVAWFLEQKAGGFPKMARIEMKEEEFNRLMNLTNES